MKPSNGSGPIGVFDSGVGGLTVFREEGVRRLVVVPLGFISLTENVMMVAMALWMVVK